MLNERVDNWTRFRKAISQHTSREFEKFMLLSNFARKLRFLYLDHRLEIVVRRNDSGGSSSSQMTDMKELSSGDRSFTQVSLLLCSGQPNGVSVPNHGRVRRVHGLPESQHDRRAPRGSCEEELQQAVYLRYPERSEFIFVTPNDLSMLRPDPVVKIQKLAPPRYRAASAGAHDVDKDGVA
ncbi:hypothetical protein PPTG_20268 [Phytophthora nicotianae INRA-310]|uniref:Uncharacterized protein n=1 Tax=Phytophthora nicotianae (strain INRA-310) TaxID=761204 RepID=W2P947_PHYN3|nr:hypothetical protein PPTG_20268 [Phytophthora nicotianae INRA-310]ETM97336.1 hypothetical protein PPTG_20268 [Phytophthora nicotianae INRA-310]